MSRCRDAHVSRGGLSAGGGAHGFVGPKLRPGNAAWCDRTDPHPQRVSSSEKHPEQLRLAAGFRKTPCVFGQRVEGMGSTANFTRAQAVKLVARCATAATDAKLSS
jgi:hypothetical protein